MKNKISFKREDGKIWVTQQGDAQPTMDSVKELKLARSPTFADEMIHLGRIDLNVLSMLRRKHGIKRNDNAAIKDLVKKMLFDPEYAAFRVDDRAYSKRFSSNPVKGKESKWLITSAS